MLPGRRLPFRGAGQGLQKGFEQPLGGDGPQLRLLVGGRQLLGQPGKAQASLVVELAQLLAGGLEDLVLLQAADEGLLRVLLLPSSKGAGRGSR